MQNKERTAQRLDSKQISNTRDFDSRALPNTLIRSLQALCESRPGDTALVLRGVLDLVPGQFVLYRQFVFETGQLTIHCGISAPQGYGDNAPLKGSVCFEEFVTMGRKRALFGDLRQTAHLAGDPDIGRYLVKSYAAVPVAAATGPVGALEVFDTRADRFHKSDLDILDIYASLLRLTQASASGGLDNKKKAVNEKTITPVLSKLLSNEEISGFLNHCLETIGWWMKADAVSLYCYDPPQKELRAMAHWPDLNRGPADADDPVPGLMGIPQVAAALSNQKYFSCNDIRAYVKGAASHDDDAIGFKSLTLFPLTNFTGLCGLFVLKMREEPRNRREEDLFMLQTTMGIMGKWIEGYALADRLQESEALNSQILRLAPMAIFRIDLIARCYTYVNDYTCRITGYTRQELLSMTSETLLAPESRQLYRKRLADIAAGLPVADHADFQIITKDKKTEWLHLHIRHIHEDGKTTAATVVAYPTTEQRKTQSELIRYREALESLVDARTQALSSANSKLQEEIERHTETAKALRINTERLKELNTTLRVLLDRRNEERIRTEENIRVNLKELIEPYLTRLADSNLSENQKQLVHLIRMNLDEVMGNSMPEFSYAFLFFSPNELQVANLIRKGKTTKEIARLLNISTRTVEAYRNSIRKKLGLRNKKVNLRTFLCSRQ